MRIVVCIKQVPDTNDVKIDPISHTLVRSSVRSVMNPFDTYAIEEALRIRDKIGGTVTAISMGPHQAEKALEEASAMGVDETVLLSDRAFAGSDTLATSYILSKAIRRLSKIDLVICGKQAIDGDTAQVGPALSIQLGIPHIAFASKMISFGDSYIELERMTESGSDTIEISLPALITVVKDINLPRIPSILNKMRAKKSPIVIWTKDDLKCDGSEIGLDGSPTMVKKIFPPKPKKGCTPIKANDKDIFNIASNIRDFLMSTKTDDGKGI